MFLQVTAPPPDSSAANPEAGLTRRDALVIGTGAAATAFLPASSVVPGLPGLQAAIVDDLDLSADPDPFPDDWVDKAPTGTNAPQGAQSIVNGVLKEYRLVGCPMFASTQRNVNAGWEQGWYYSFQAPRTGTVTKFMWQTQGAREHGAPGDKHSHGNFGHYTIKFYRYTAFGAQKGSLLAQGRFADGVVYYYPGWQDNSSGSGDAAPYTPAAYPSPDSSHYGGRAATAELRGGIHVHAWLERTLPYPPPPAVATSHPYAGTAFVYIDIDKYGGGSWTVSAGDWIIAEFVNFDGSPASNFSADNNASSIGAPRPGNYSQGSPLDGKLSVIKYIANTPNTGSGQPAADLSMGRDIVPFFLLGYSDAKWYGQPWFYRGTSRFPGSTPPNGSSNGLYDVNATSGASLSVDKRGPALLIYAGHRLRQILTPPADFVGTSFSEICVHAWRWTSLGGYTTNARLGVRILRVGTTNAKDVSTGLLQVWPRNDAGGSGVFNVDDGTGPKGPFAAFPLNTFTAFGNKPDQDDQSRILSITPSNLQNNYNDPNNINPRADQFYKWVGILKYGRMALTPSLSYNGMPVGMGNNYRYIIEIAVENNTAYAIQLNQNMLNLINKSKDTNQGLATLSVGGPKRSAISIPQIWPAGTSDSGSTGRLYNATGKYYADTGKWVDMFDQMLPICLIPTT